MERALSDVHLLRWIRPLSSLKAWIRKIEAVDEPLKGNGFEICIVLSILLISIVILM